MRYILIILVFLSVGAKAQMVIKAHANYRPYAQPAANLLLDDYPNAAAAYSLRKLDKDYTGSAIRVRKDTTGQPEQDIGFTASGDLDTVGLKNFLSTRSGFVTTWYDQSGSGRNATQTTQAKQPRIANLGVIERINNKVSIFYDGSNDDFLINNFTQNNGFYSFFGVTQIANTTGNKTVMSGDGGVNPRSAQYMTIISSNPRTLAFDVNTAISDQSAAIIANTMYLLSGHKYAGFIEAYTNGASNGATTFTNASNSTNANIYIGSQLSSSAFMQGYISECIMYGTNNHSNRTGIENNINDYHNIYWNGDFTGLLDTYPNSAAAYSLRNLSSTYTGPLIRVRKDTTGQPEMDIYGDYYGNLDTVGLKNFLLTRSGFVSVWYNQNGTGRNATMATSTRQPRIANLGVIDRDGGKPAVFFDGTSDLLETPIDEIDLVPTEEMTAFCLVNATGTTGFPSIIANFDQPTGGDPETGWIFRFTNASKIQLTVARTGSYSSITSNDNRRGARYLFNLYAKGDSIPNQSKLYTNNTLLTTTTSSINRTLTNVTYPIRIGATKYLGTFYDFFPGTMQEIIIYKANRDADRTGIESNINTHYGIY